MSKLRYSFAIAALLAAMLACNLPSSAQSNQQDPGAILTAAALTVQAQIPTNAATSQPAPTQPIPPTATLTPVPSPTTVPPTATSNCDSAQFVTDVTYPDGTTITAGDDFTKTWRLRNNGTCSWTPSYALVFISGDSMSGPAVQALTGNVNPGQTVDISVALTAPSNNGSYTGNWGLRNASGIIFAHFFIQINVGGGGGGPFAVNHVTMSVSGSCGGFHITASITTTNAGSVTYHWVRSDGATDTLTHPAVVYASAGTKSVSTDWSVSAHGSYWMDIYIDTPNHQQFGRANFSCP